MKAFVCCVLLLFFFSGCDQTDEMSRALLLRQELAQRNGCRFLCAVTADYVDEVYTFTLDCGFDQLGNMAFRVVAPDYISGITGAVDHTGGKLTFEEQALAFPLLADGYLSPVSAPWLFMQALRGGYMESCGVDGDGFRITLKDTYAEKAMQVDVWLNSENVPVYCEMLWSGRRILSFDVTEFSYM